MSTTKLALGFALAIALALTLGLVSSARAQGPDIQIVQLECTGDPELVVIENRGDAAQALAGWELQSDPPDTEVFDLTVLGGLQPEASVFIQSGPSASGVFKWGLEFVFRDDDPTDYARIVDDTGAVVHQVNCGAEVVPEPSPTPSPEPSPTPSPEPSPPNGVPNGGGPPPPPGDALLAAMTVLVGGSMAAAGVATGALSGLRLRSSPVAGSATALALRPAAARPHAQPRGPDGSHRQPNSAALRLALVGLLAAALAFRLLWRRSQGGTPRTETQDSGRRRPSSSQNTRSATSRIRWSWDTMTTALFISSAF